MALESGSPAERIWARDTVHCPVSPTAEALQLAFFEWMPRLVLGLVRARKHSFWFGPFCLFRFGEPVRDPAGYHWDIEGGLMLRRAGGQLAIGWSEGELFLTVQGFRPRLPGWLDRLTELPFHHQITRHFLLMLRGRRPTAGVPAIPVARLAAGAIDVAACLGLAWTLRKKQRLRRAAAVAAVYHLIFWSAGGRTPGGRLLGIRVVAVDGSRLSPVQAAIRLLSLPWALRKLRALHDEAAAADVIQS